MSIRTRSVSNASLHQLFQISLEESTKNTNLALKQNLGQKSVEPTFSRQQLLAEWEAVHGRLTSELREKFLARQELEELALYPEGVIRRAIKNQPRLKKILAKARKLKPGTRIAADKAASRQRNSSDSRSQPLPLPGDPGATKSPG